MALSFVSVDVKYKLHGPSQVVAKTQVNSLFFSNIENDELIEAATTTGSIFFSELGLYTWT